ncbi:reverse transcriptase domain-containing protein [Tanacetum coccineum]
MEESLSKFMVESIKRHEENSNLIKEIRASKNATIRNQRASIKALEIQIGKMSKAIVPFPSCLYDDCYDEEEGSCGLKNFDAYSIGTSLLDDSLPPKENAQGVSLYLVILIIWLGELAPTKLIVELADRTVKRPKGIAKNVLVGMDKFVLLVFFIVLDIPEDLKTPLILGRPFLSTAHAKIDVFKRKITLGIGNDKVVFKSEKPTSNIINRVYALSLRERMELDLEARLMVEALILNRSLDLLYGDYIKLNDLNEPLELWRNQVDDLEPTIEEGEVIDEPIMDIVKTRCDDEIIDGLDEYLSYCDFDRKIHIDCAYNLQFSCIIDFIVMENMDSYRDEGMGDIIVRRPFCREACVKARRFDGIITIYKWNDSVTYQMARSHPRFKHLTNAQCNKMRPLLKVSAHDKLKGPY